MGGSEEEGTEALRLGGTKGGRGDWVFRIVIVLMAVLFVITIVERNRIRAYWWAMRLAQSDRIEEQSYYLSCLTSTGPTGLGAVTRLCRDERASVRVLAVHALRAMPVESGLEELEALARDGDETVRESAALGLAFRGDRASLAALRGLLRSDQEGASASAAAALGRTRDAESLAAICDAALRHKSAMVRAQAAEALMDVVISSGQEAISQGAATTRRFEGCDPVGTLEQMLGDKGEFTRWLSLERQTAAAAVFAKAEVESRGEVKKRTVGDVARAMLAELKRENRD